MVAISIVQNVLFVLSNIVFLDIHKKLEYILPNRFLNEKMPIEFFSTTVASNVTSDTHSSHVGQGARTLVFETVNIGQGDHHTQHLSQVDLPVQMPFIFNLCGTLV